MITLTVSTSLSTSPILRLLQRRFGTHISRSSPPLLPFSSRSWVRRNAFPQSSGHHGTQGDRPVDQFQGAGGLRGHRSRDGGNGHRFISSSQTADLAIQYREHIFTVQNVIMASIFPKFKAAIDAYSRCYFDVREYAYANTRLEPRENKIIFRAAEP